MQMRGQVGRYNWSKPSLVSPLQPESLISRPVLGISDLPSGNAQALSRRPVASRVLWAAATARTPSLKYKVAKRGGRSPVTTHNSLHPVYYFVSASLRG